MHTIASFGLMVVDESDFATPTATAVFYFRHIHTLSSTFRRAHFSDVNTRYSLLDALDSDDSPLATTMPYVTRVCLGFNAKYCHTGLLPVCWSAGLLRYL